MTDLPDQTPIVPDHQMMYVIRRGGYGEVWLARNELGQARAVKVVHRALFDDDRPYYREWEGVLKYEPISRRHENLISILHVGKNDEAGLFYYVMELADNADPDKAYIGLDPKSETGSKVVFGPDRMELTPEQIEAALTYDIDLDIYQSRSLKAVIEKRAPLPPSEIFSIIEPLIEALAFLHENGLVHRDIKPSNVLYHDGKPCFADPGLIAVSDANLSLVGTPGYMPPEGPGRATGDVFSMGIMLYEMLTGFDRQSFPSLPDNLVSGDGDKTVTGLNQIFLKACDTKQARRYQNAGEMIGDVHRISGGEAPLYIKKRSFVKKVLVASIYLTAVLCMIWLISLVRQASTSGDINWDFEYAYKHIYATNSLKHVVGRENIQRMREWQDPPMTYWAPVTSEVVAKLTYRFDFPKPTRDVYLQANCSAWNFENEPGSNSKSKGAYAILGSVDGTNWVDLINRLEPKIVWGRDGSRNDYRQVVPSTLTGAKHFWVQIRLLSKNVPENAAFNPIQHSRTDDFESDLFIVRAKY